MGNFNASYTEGFFSDSFELVEQDVNEKVTFYFVNCPQLLFWRWRKSTAERTLILGRAVLLKVNNLIITPQLQVIICNYIISKTVHTRSTPFLS